MDAKTEETLIQQEYAERYVSEQVKVTRKPSRRKAANRSMSKSPVNRQLRTDKSTSPESDEARTRLADE